MKTNWHKFLILGALVLAFSGCALIDKFSKPQIMTATDGSCELTVPGSWTKETSLNAVANIQASNRFQEQYVIVIRDAKKDFGQPITLDFLTNSIRDDLKTKLSNPIFNPSAPTTVGGFPAQEFEASGTVQNIQIKYHYAIIETPQNFYQVIAWSLTSKFDGNRSKLMEVVNSFKEIGGGGGGSGTGNGIGTGTGTGSGNGNSAFPPPQKH